MNKKPKGWYKEIVIRPVIPVDGYESYEKLCSLAADIYYSSEEDELQYNLIANPKETIHITLYTMRQVAKAKCPAYWVGKDLLEALQQSVLNVEVDNLNWAMKTGLFVLPKKLILSPEKRSVKAIFWHYDTAKDLLFFTATDGDSFFCRRFQVSDNLRKLTYTDSEDINPQVVAGFNEYLQSIFLRLILIMECRPELVDAPTKQQKVTVNQGFGKAQALDFYQPLWIGQEYRFKRENIDKGDSSSKQGSSKSPHWRKGFLRNQPYGEGRQQRKLVWIEPVLVMGGE